MLRQIFISLENNVQLFKSSSWYRKQFLNTTASFKLLSCVFVLGDYSFRANKSRHYSSWYVSVKNRDWDILGMSLSSSTSSCGIWTNQLDSPSLDFLTFGMGKSKLLSWIVLMMIKKETWCQELCKMLGMQWTFQFCLYHYSFGEWTSLSNS